ncbi:ABATE domain-containing protein [Frankia sp. QA3]|uniref:CGNR zinc finger domain-containing protein n=1 Tax=Frankia sp. QA3 TaxID=710111 RepID=UPI000269B8C3|nr:CGNR zinc finger domain-containing protein [Frankia sp. QA3]EIV90832.1 Zn-ribbon-like motif-containing protein [Frankia sp. QA3]
MRESGTMTEFDRGAGSLCLDFVATVRDWPGRHVELLATPAELTGWFEEQGLPAAAGGLTEPDLLAARALRGAVNETTRGLIVSRPPTPEDIRLINTAGRRPTPVFLLGPGGRTRTPVPEPDAAAALSVIARDAINLLAGPDLSRVRTCDSDGCATLFLDRSPSGRRRWCSMRRCGGRAAAANYRRRRAARSQP